MPHNNTGTQGHVRTPGSTAISLEITNPTTSTSNQVQRRIDSLNEQIIHIQAQIVELEAEKLLVAAQEPPNVDAVVFSIEQLDQGSDRNVVEAKLEIAPWNFSVEDAVDIVNDAVEIIAER